jgi:allophanate hydrolase
MLADPIQLNSNLGVYTNFVNLLDLSAIAVPAGFQRDGLPFGVTLLAPAWNDGSLCALADAIHRVEKLAMGALKLPMPPPRARASGAAAANGMIKVAVCGAHMKDLPLNHQLTDRGGSLVKKTRTAKGYRLYALPGGPPARPGMVRTPGGKAIEVEVWQLPEREFGGFMKAIPAPLAIGTIELGDGDKVKGFLCESAGLLGAEDITALGGWRRYLAAQKKTAKRK